MDKIKDHYIKQSEKYGFSKLSTMPDANTRDKEVEMIIKQLGDLNTCFENPKILEVGCGNGYTVEQIGKNLDGTSITCIDFCEEFIEIVKKRNLKNVNPKVGNVLNLEFDNSSFDIIFTERCLINLVTWEKQQRALKEIRRVLKIGGFYIMLEAFTDGLNNLNEARKVIGLDAIPQPFHNLYIEKHKFLDHIKDKFENVIYTPPLDNFLSSYYFGSRVLYAGLIAGKKEIVYNNKFIEFFKFLPAYGNYSYIQMFILKKK